MKKALLVAVLVLASAPFSVHASTLYEQPDHSTSSTTLQNNSNTVLYNLGTGLSGRVSIRAADP